MSEDDYHNAIIDWMTELKALCGAVIYEDKRNFEIQLETLKLFILSSWKFSNLTISELRQAFHLNNQGEYDEIYTHYGRPLDGEFAGKVLAGFLKYKRPILDVMEDVRKKIAGPTVLPVLPPTESAMQEMIQQDYDMYRAGEPEMVFIPPTKYYYLRRIGFILFDTKAKWLWGYQQAILQRQQQFVDRIGDTEGQRLEKERMRSIYALVTESRIIPKLEHRVLIHNARRIVYLRWLKMLRECGINNIFTDIEINHIKP